MYVGAEPFTGSRRRQLAPFARQAAAGLGCAQSGWRVLSTAPSSPAVEMGGDNMIGIALVVGIGGCRLKLLPASRAFAAMRAEVRVSPSARRNIIVQRQIGDNLSR